MSMMQERDDRRWEREERAIEKKGKGRETHDQDTREGWWEEGRKGKRRETNDQDAREGGKEEGREERISWYDDDGSDMSYISIDYE